MEIEILLLSTNNGEGGGEEEEKKKKRAKKTQREGGKMILLMMINTQSRSYLFKWKQQKEKEKKCFASFDVLEFIHTDPLNLCTYTHNQTPKKRLRICKYQIKVKKQIDNK